MTITAIPTALTKGEKRIQLILDAALALLIDKGYHNFSMRKVAAKANISVGNLQYYFPSKTSLLETLLESFITEFLGSFEQIRQTYQGSPKQQFVKIIEAVIKDLNTKRTTNFFPELWCMANHEDFFNQAMDRMYGSYRSYLTEIIREMNPKLSEAQASKLSIFITATIEGHTIFIGYQKPFAAETDNLIKMSIQSFLWLIESGDIPD